MNTQSTHHLEMEELLALVDGLPLPAEARAHLAACSTCRSESERWTAVALGVRHHAATLTRPSTTLFDQIRLGSLDPHSPLGLQREGHHGAGGPRRRRALVAAAAGLVVIGGGSYGLNVALGGGGSGSRLI